MPDGRARVNSAASSRNAAQRLLLVAEIESARLHEKAMETRHAEAVEKYLAACRALTIFDARRSTETQGNTDA